MLGNTWSNLLEFWCRVKWLHVFAVLGVGGSVLGQHKLERLIDNPF